MKDEKYKYKIEILFGFNSEYNTKTLKKLEDILKSKKSEKEKTEKTLFYGKKDSAINDFISQFLYSKKFDFKKIDEIKIEGLTEEDNNEVKEWFRMADKAVEDGIIERLDFCNIPELLKKVRKHYNKT